MVPTDYETWRTNGQVQGTAHKLSQMKQATGRLAPAWRKSAIGELTQFADIIKAFFFFLLPPPPFCVIQLQETRKMVLKLRP